MTLLTKKLILWTNKEIYPSYYFLFGWMYDLGFYALFNSVSDMPGQQEGDNV